MKRVFVKHGFFTADEGRGSTDLIHPYLTALGYKVVDDDYGFLGLYGVRTKTQEIVDDLVKRVQVGDHYVGFSHGCAIGAKALEQGAHFKTMVLIHPALHRSWEPPEWFTGEIHVFYHWTDYATWGALLLRNASPGNLLWGQHDWGAMGSLGPSSVNPCFIKHKGSLGHANGGFRNIEKWGPIWAGCLP